MQNCLKIAALVLQTYFLTIYVYFLKYDVIFDVIASRCDLIKILDNFTVAG